MFAYLSDFIIREAEAQGGSGGGGGVRAVLRDSKQAESHGSVCAKSASCIWCCSLRSSMCKGPEVGAERKLLGVSM